LRSAPIGATYGRADSPTNYGPSVFGTSWFAQPPQQQQPRRAQPQNPFEDIVTRSYLGTSGSRDGLAQMSNNNRRSQGIQKAMIGQPHLQGNSLEFRDRDYE
jgi:hypothetical protein